MCGIAGIVTKHSKRYQSSLNKMSEKIKHRGPDGSGEIFFENCALAHRRLSIIDIDNGAQPMLNENSNIGITFNGEIYGFKEIRQRELKNYSFKSSSDTEVILALYEKYGQDFLSNLSGMFAFAIWNEQQQTLICARDRFGEKPLYYAFGESGEFLFASEIKAILSSNLLKPKIRKKSLAHYLQRLYVDPRHTIYENVYTLPPAHMLIFKSGRLTISRYWHIPEINNFISLPEAVNEFKRLLDRSIKNQLVSDVPVGAFLSGGLDSSTVVALSSKYRNKIKTFSFAFQDGNNELKYAREISNKYGTEHIELFDNEPISDLLLKMQDIYDEPFADSSNIPTYLISKLARKYTKVILSGDGSDELLGGYSGYKALFYLKQNQLMWNNILVWFISRVISRMPVYRRDYLLYKQIGASYGNDFNSILEAQLSPKGVFSDSEMQHLNLYGDTQDDYVPSWTETGNINDALRVDTEKYLAGDILVKTDRASMASGLELRSPFLDVDFANFCLQLPQSLKISKETDKYILRKSYQNLWTHSIRKRRKLGFGGPVNSWLGKADVKEIYNEYLINKNKKIFSILPYDHVQKIIKNKSTKTWNLLILSLWLENNKHICLL